MHGLQPQIPIAQVTTEELDALMVSRAPGLLGSPEARRIEVGWCSGPEPKGKEQMAKEVAQPRQHLYLHDAPVERLEQTQPPCPPFPLGTARRGAWHGGFCLRTRINPSWQRTPPSVALIASFGVLVHCTSAVRQSDAQSRFPRQELRNRLQDAVASQAFLRDERCSDPAALGCFPARGSVRIISPYGSEGSGDATADVLA